jgi:hypothetical protein
MAQQFSLPGCAAKLLSHIFPNLHLDRVEFYIGIPTLLDKGQPAVTQPYFGRQRMSPHRTSSCQQIARYLGALGGLALTLGFGGCVSSVHFPSVYSASSVTLDGSLYRPQGPGPFPAMVLLHTCSGVQRLELQ